jgi:hypothetical protein
VDTTRFTTAEIAITAMPKPMFSISPPLARRREASYTITPAPTRISMPSIAAARFSALAWPYWCSASAGSSALRSDR